MRAEEVDVTVIIVNYNTRELIRPCIDALRAGAVKMRLQIVVVDNGSRDCSADLLRAEFAWCDLVINEVNVGFGRANNQALQVARGRHVLLLNTDAFVPPNIVDHTVEFIEANPECGVLGVRLVGRDGSLQPSCRYFPTPWNEFLIEAGLTRLFPRTRLIDDMDWDHALPRECDWVPGCYYLVRKSVIDQVGLFDPRFFLYYEEVDHCRNVKAAGWTVMFYPYATVVHIGGESAKSDFEITKAGRQVSALQIESGLLYFRKHYGLPGLGLSFVLLLLSSGLLACKGALRRRPVNEIRACWARVALTWSLMRQTSWAERPTR